MATDRSSSKEGLMIELDPYWLNYGKRIRNLVGIIDTPHTKVGEEVLKNFWNASVIRNYNRLHQIIGGLIALVEYEEIGKIEGRNYFSNPTNQIIALNAFSLFIEGKIKNESYEREDKSYEDYKKFFERLFKRLNQMEEQVKQEIRFPNFLNSLGMIISQEIQRLGVGGGFYIEMDKIRKEIKDYLLELKKLEGGQIFSEIGGKIKWALLESSPQENN